MAELIYNNQRHAYETILDNGDTFSVDEQAVSEAMQDRFRSWPDADETLVRVAVLDSSIWSEDMDCVTIIHPDGSVEYEDDNPQVQTGRVREYPDGNIEYVPTIEMEKRDQSMRGENQITSRIEPITRGEIREPELRETASYGTRAYDVFLEDGEMAQAVEFVIDRDGRALRVAVSWKGYVVWTDLPRNKTVADIAQQEIARLKQEESQDRH